MNRSMLTGLVIFASGAVFLGGCKQGAATAGGEALFTQYCAVCHPNGGNNINPKKTLFRKDLEANGVKTAADIVMKMRSPGPGMPKFGRTAIPDKDATAIAEYILATFR